MLIDNTVRRSMMKHRIFHMVDCWCLRLRTRVAQLSKRLNDVTKLTMYGR